MNFELIETFLALEKARNFSRAAEVLFVSQSTVTVRLKVLEKELGAELFVRDSKNVSLTVAGAAFTEYAQKLNKLMADGRKTIQNLGKYECNMTVAAPDSVWKYTLLEPLEGFMDKNPKTAFHFICGHSEYIVADLIDGIVDIGVSFWKPFNTEIEVVPYFESDYYLVARTGLLPDGESLTTQNIGEFPFIYMDWGPEFNRWYGTYYKCKEFGIQVERVSLFVDLLLSGRGAGFLTERSARPYLESGELVQIAYPYAERVPRDKAYLLYLKKNREKVLSLVEWIIGQQGSVRTWNKAAEGAAAQILQD